MKRFDYEVAVNQLSLGKGTKLNNGINYDLIPSWVQSKDFLNLFLPYLKIVGDSIQPEKMDGLYSRKIDGVVTLIMSYATLDKVDIGG